MRLREALGSNSHARLGPQAERALVRSLTDSLLVEAGRTLVLELNVARTLDRLPGETPEQRFTYFTTRHLADAASRDELLCEYPVLARLLTTSVERWLNATVELLERLGAERSQLERRFGAGAPLGEVIDIRLGASDAHRAGRAVAILDFASGVKIVYKPRPLAIDVEFQSLLGWINTIGLSLDHETLEILDYPDHGWVEFVEHRPCETLDSVRRFYARQGSMLALLHVLRATDVHFENLIAAGEYPVVVDLESLFHHRRPTIGTPSAVERALMALKDSVFFVGMLPVFALGPGREHDVDFSALGGRAGQQFPHPTPALEDVGRDSMRFTQQLVVTSGARNRPTLNGDPVDAAAHVQDILAGFIETYTRLVAERSALMARLDAFADVEIRHIFRPTFHYKFLLNAARHPDFLRDGMDRERALNRLWTGMATQPILRAVVRFEHADLLAGDVPIFTTRPGSRDLWSSRGERIPEFFPTTSLDACKQRLAAMGERDCEEQVKLLRMSLRTLK
ncbi:type 2 lanthipeptide synthetase LanM [Nannocystaceae bacterium ST9]